MCNIYTSDAQSFVERRQAGETDTVLGKHSETQFLHKKNLVQFVGAACHCFCF